MKIDFVRLLVAVAVSLSAIGCTSVQVNVKQADKADQAARVLRTQIEFVDRTYQTIPYAIVEQEPKQRDVYKYVVFHDPLEVSFYSVSGRLAGVPGRLFRIRLKRAYAWIEPGTQKDFAISLAAMEDTIRSHASVYMPRPEDSDFKVEPAETRFARLLISAGDPFSYPYSEREAGFIDRKTDSRFALLYVDRPCRITGSIQANDGTFKHDLVFNQAGLHWMHVQAVGEKGALVTRLDPVGPVSVYVRYINLLPR